MSITMMVFSFLILIGLFLLLLAALPYIIYLFGIYFGKKVEKLHVENASELPEISVVICAYEEERNIGRKIQSICDCTYPQDKIEVVIVIDKSSDNTEGVARDKLTETNLKWIVHENNERTGKNL